VIINLFPCSAVLHETQITGFALVLKLENISLNAPENVLLVAERHALLCTFCIRVDDGSVPVWCWNFNLAIGRYG
jgi:hypothetical protein